MKIETWMQDSKVKGLRMVDFEVENEHGRIWIEEDGTRSYRYGVKSLIENGWVKMDERDG